MATPNFNIDQAVSQDLRREIEQILAERQQQPGQPAPQPPPPPHIAVNLNGREIVYDDPTKLSKDIEEMANYLNQTQQQLAALQQQQSQRPGQQVQSADTTPQFDINLFADTLIKDPTKALSYGFKFTPEYQQFSQVQAELQQRLAAQQTELEISRFRNANPDYVPTPRNAQVLSQICQSNGWQMNAGSLEAAYALAAKRGFLETPPPQPQQQPQQWQEQPVQQAQTEAQHWSMSPTATGPVYQMPQPRPQMPPQRMPMGPPSPGRGFTASEAEAGFTENDLENLSMDELMKLANRLSGGR